MSILFLFASSIVIIQLVADNNLPGRRRSSQVASSASVLQNHATAGLLIRFVRFVTFVGVVITRRRVLNELNRPPPGRKAHISAPPRPWPLPPTPQGLVVMDSVVVTFVDPAAVPFVDPMERSPCPRSEHVPPGQVLQPETGGGVLGKG